MDVLERARKLRQEADLILEEVGVWRSLRQFGVAQATGSYFLDLMVYPDIDLYLSRVSLEELFSVGAALARHPWVIQVVFEKDLDGSMDGGLYLKPRIRHGEWGRAWKIDIWSLDQPGIDRRMETMHGFEAKLTPEVRERILACKASLLTAELRTPMYSGYWICKAFLEEGLRDPEQVRDYLVEHGVRLPGSHA